MSKKISVLFYTDPTAFQIFGGAELQMLKTKEYIEKLYSEISVKFFNQFEDKLDDYDILHIFNLRTECMALSKLAKKKKLKLVISPIFWPENNHKRTLSNMLQSFENFWLNFYKYRYPTFKPLYPNKTLLELADIILPNSQEESKAISHYFQIPLNRFSVIPNAVDKNRSNISSDLFFHKYGLKDFVLFVGRIEKRKNLLALINAVKDTPVDLVIIGHPNPEQYEYFTSCKEAAQFLPNVHFFNFFIPQSEELFSAYAAAKVFVLPSFFETPGLSALEAAMMGCNIVITNGGSTSEYFKNYVSYINPSNITEIRTAIQKNYTLPKNGILREYVLNNYTWEIAAKKTFDSYKRILN